MKSEIFFGCLGERGSSIRMTVWGRRETTAAQNAGSFERFLLAVFLSGI